MGGNKKNNRRRRQNKELTASEQAERRREKMTGIAPRPRTRKNGNNVWPVVERVEGYSND